MRRLIGLSFGALLVLAVGGQARASLMIDDFNTPPFPPGQVASSTSGVVKNSMSGLANVLQGSREIQVNHTSQIGVGLQPVTASANVNNTGIFNFDQFSSTARGIAFLTYDRLANGNLNKTGFSPAVDLTQGGLNTGFLFNNLNVTGSGLKLTVDLYNKTTSGVFSSGVITLVNGFNGAMFLPFASFTGAGGAGTPTNVGAIRITIDGRSRTAAGSDLTFDFVAAAPPPVTTPTPEPSTMAMGLIGIGGLVIRRRWMARRVIA